MATTTPIDVERYLLQGEGEDPALDLRNYLGGRTPGASVAPTKPDLEDALLSHYNSTATQKLAPGQLPPQIEAPAPPATPTLLDKARQLVPSISMPNINLPNVMSRIGEGASEAIAPGSSQLVQPAPTSPSGLSPTPQAEKPSGWYSTIQKHAGFVRDVAEAGGQTLAGMGAFAFGAATAVSDILNAQLSRVAKGGPTAGGPESSTHYRDIFTRMDKTISDLTPEPRSDIAKNVNKAVGTVTGLVKDVAELPGKGLVATGIMNEDTARVLSFATELYLFYRLDRGIREAAPELRAKIADFKTRMSKAGSDAEVASAAEGLADAAAKNPKLDPALDEARGKFRNEADREAGRPPRGPKPPDEGPAGGGAYYDPADLATYQEQLRNFTDFYKSAEPNASFSEFKAAIEEFHKGVAPQPRPAPAEPVRPTAQAPTEPVAPRAPEPTHVTPAGNIILNEDLHSYIDGQVAAGMNVDQIVRNVRPSVDASISNAQIREAIRTQTPAPQPQAAPAEPTRAAPTMERPVQPEVVVGQDTAVAPRAPDPRAPEVAATTVREEVIPPPPAEPPVVAAAPPQAAPSGAYGSSESIRTEISNTLAGYEGIARIIDNRLRRGEIDLAGAARLASERIGIPIEQGMRVAELTSELIRRDREGSLGARTQAAATVAPETVPAPVSPEAPAVAAVPPSPARQLFDDAKEAASTTERNSNLAELKTLAKDSGKTVRDGLEQLGFTPDEVSILETQLRKVRARRAGIETLQQVAEKPAVQTAASEAVLETKPAGTEVEIPAPAEPVVDTSPAIEKPRRKRRIVKAPDEAQLARNAAAEAMVGEMRAVRERAPAQRAELSRQLNNAGRNPEAILGEIQRGYESGIQPLDMRNELIRRGIPEAVARDVTDTAYDMHVRGTLSPVAATSAAAEVAAGTGVETGTAPVSSGVTFTTIDRMPNLEVHVRGETALAPAGSEPVMSPLQVRAANGKPNAIFVDTARLNTRTSLADIQAQTQRGRMSADVASMTQANLERQAQLFGVPIGVAHTTTGQELEREATRIAAENNLDLYVKKGKNYELVPRDVVRTDAKLNRGDDLAPTPISKDVAGAYVESKTSDIGPATVREIMDAIEQGVDISDRLPSELLPHYRSMRDAERAGIDTSERASFIDILTDFNTMLGEAGSIGGNFTRAQRMAAQRLQAEMRKAGKNAREFLFGARPEDVAVFERYLDTINNPVPPNSTNPRNMRFDPENVIPGDKVVKHRTVSAAQQRNAVPLWESEVKGIQNARDIKAGGTEWDLKLPIRQHKAAGTEFLYYAYRTSQKNLNAELNVLHSDMQELARGFSSKSLENIGANGYKRQGPDGQRILTYNKVAPTPLSPAERRLQATIDGIYAETFNRLQETRAATGREPLARVDDYQTFARTISLLGHLGIKIDLARATAAEVNAAYIKHRATNFPYVVRKHAFYTAEMNALKILDTYMQSALKDIHLSPFLAKIHELIETNLPNPVTGKEDWMLKEEKPGLYNELRAWTDYLSTGTNKRIPDNVRIMLNTMNRNIAYATLSGLIRSGGIQISTLVNTQQALGPINTFNAVIANLADHVSGGKRRQFALDNSEILSSRKFVDAYNEVAGAIIGRRPRDFFHAIRTGDFGSIQQAAGRPGFKLMELMDMEAAVMSWNGAYKQARSRAMNYSHKDAVRYADDLVVRTQGSSMPGDLSGVQRNALGKLVTQFQTFLISDWNFLTKEVLSKGKIGGGGGGQIPPGGVASGSGSFETGGPRTRTQFVKNAVQFLIATQLVNELFKMLHIQPAQPDPVKDVQTGIAAGHGPVGLVFDLAVGQIERVPFVGGMRYGRGMTGPFFETARDLARAARNDPLTRNPYEQVLKNAGVPEPQIMSKIAEPAATLIGVPLTRQIGKTALGLKRGESPYDSLMGWYSEESGRSQRARPERRERRRR